MNLTALATALTLIAPPVAADPTFADCPALPAGANPAEWRCEVLTSEATVSFGNVRELRLGTMRLTFAEGRLDNEYAQVVGALRSEPTEVPGLPGTSVRFRYAGYSDFQSNDDRKGEIDLAAVFEGSLLPPGCESGPVHSVLRAAGPTQVVSTDPLTLRFATVDEQLSFPATEGCGPLTRALNHRLGLPSPSGNSYAQTTLVRLQSY